MTGPFQEALAVLKTSPEELTAEGQALMQGGDRPTGQRFLNTANAFDAGPALENRLVQGQGINAARAMNQLVGSNDNTEELANYARLLYDEGRESPDYHEARDNPDYRGKDELQAFYEAMSKLHHGKERVAGMNEAAESQLSQLRADDPSQFWADQRVRTGEPMDDAWSSLLKELSGDEPYRTPTCLTCGRGFATLEDLEYHYSVSGHASSPYEKPSDDDADDWSNYDPNKNQGEY